MNSTDQQAIPLCLRERPQWVLWRLEKIKGDAKKMPYQTDGKSAKSNDPSTWDTFDNIIQLAWQYTGIGYVFSAEDPYCGIDLDGCRDPKTGIISPWAATIIQRFRTYSEISPSGTGVKLFGRGKLPANIKHKIFPANAPKVVEKKPGIECYDELRYFAVTGNRLDGYDSHVEDCQEAIQWLCEEYPELLPKRRVLPPPPPTPARHDVSRNDAIKQARAYAVKIPGAVEDGSVDGRTGGAHTFYFCCVLFDGFGLSRDEARPIFDEWNQTCVPPWTDEGQIRHKFDDAEKAAATSGRRGYLLMDRRADPIGVNAANNFTSTGSTSTNGASVGSVMRRALPSPYKSFPIALLPEPLRSYVQQSADAIGCDHSFTALPALSVVASLIGNKRSIKLKNGWYEPCIIWVAIIGESGSHKSPALSAVVDPLNKIQKEKYKAWQIAMEHYRSEMRTWKDMPKNERGDEPKAPILERVILSDATIEAAAKIVSENPAGVLLGADELAGWIGSFTRYKSAAGGSDMQKWLEAHGGRSWIIDRKTGESKTQFIQHVAISVCGGIQPGIIAKQLTGEHWAAGFSARLLLAMPDRKAKIWTEDEIGLDTQTAYDELLRSLLALDFHRVGNEAHPHALKMSRAAKAEWINFYNQWGRKQADSTGNEAAAFSKLEGYAARLTLVHHIIKRIGAGMSDLVEIETDSINAGIALAHWFADETERIYAILAEDETQGATRRLVDMIRTRGGSITVRGLQRKGSKYANADAAKNALDDLVKDGYGEWRESPPSPRGGHRIRTFHLMLTLDTSDTRFLDDDEADTPIVRHSPDTCSDTPIISRENGQVSEVSCVGHESEGESQDGGHHHTGERVSDVDLDAIK